MEQPDADARSREDYVVTARLEGQEGAGAGGLAMVAAPEVSDGLGDDKMVCGAQERRLSTEEDEDEEKERGGGFAVESVEAIPSPFEGMGQIGEEKGSSLEERSMDVDEEKRGSFPVESGESAACGNLPMCHVANGGFADKTLCVTCGEAFCSKDVRCVRDTLDKATEGSQCEREGLAGSRGDWGGGVEVKTSIEDLQMVCEEAHCDNEGLSDSMKHDSKRWPRGVDGVEFMADANNELKHDDLMPKIEAEVSRLVCEDSVPSVSGSIGVSVDGKAGWVGEISGDSVTCHVADGGVWNKGLCTPFGEGSQSKDAGCMYDTMDKATEGSQCEQEGLAGEGGVFCDGVKVKTSLEDLQMCCKEPHCDNEGLSDSLIFDIQRLPDGMGVVRLKRDANHELEKDGLLPKIGEEISRPVHEDSVPSISGSYLVVSLDSKAGEIGEICEHRTAMEKVACGSQGVGMLSCESGFWKEASGDENQCSRLEVKTSEERLQTCWMEACHDNEGLSVSGKHDIENLPRAADGLRLMIDANHELEKDRFLPNIDAEVSWPLDEASVPSIYENPTDVPLDGKVGRVGEISENRTCLEKLACDSLGGDMLSCETGFRTEASGDENQHSRMGVSKGLTSSVCKEANMESLKACDPCAEIEVPFQPTDQKDGTSDLSPERDQTCSSYNKPCEDEPCCSGRESSALYLGHQDYAGVESGHSDHLAQELNRCNSDVDKPCSVDFVKNGNGELQDQKSAQLIVFRRRNPRRAASSRNLNLEKHDQINKASNNTHKSKKVESSGFLLQSTMIKFPNKTTKGRSGINRPLKSYVWGSLLKLMDGFGQNCGPSTSNSHLACLQKGISNRRSDKKRQLTIRKSRSSRCSKNKCAAFSDIGYALDELNGQPTISVTTDVSASSEGHIGNSPKLTPHALVDVSDDPCKTAQCTEGNHTLKLTSIQTDRWQSDRGLESVTQETGPAYIHGVCAISTSEPSPKNVNVGFSPDSVLEVASVTCENSTSASHDVIVREKSDPGALTGGGCHASVLFISDFGRNHASSTMDLEQRAKTVRGNDITKKEEISPSHAILDNDIGEGNVQALEKSNTVRKSKSSGRQEHRKKDGIKGKNTKNRSSTKISSIEAPKLRASSNDSSLLAPSESLLCTGPPKFGSCFEALTSATQDLDMHEHDSMQGPSVTDNEKSLRRKKKDDHRGKKGKMWDPHVKGKSKKKNIADDTFLDCGSFSLPSQLATDLAASHMNEQSNLSPATELACKDSAAISTELPRNVACQTDGASVPPPLRAAWVCCDDCQKWRCIPAELADIIGETNCRWTCKDNRDKVFADCSIPQEKTNSEINAELELSDASADEADNDGSNSKASRVPSWTHVRSNLFLHRNRRTQSIDESMVCNCKPPQDGRMGCRDGCLNRMLNIECVKRTCPCGEHCSNQQFQRRTYAKLSWFHSGKKGYGLQLLEDVSEGRFLIEYVGEVLDIMAYESRQRYYASKGQKHFYFMALNGGEVIDACTKGNLGRFINHSCSPNCRTEKWMVNGEVCIGIFSMRNIRKGEELTFDYNYVRVSCAAPQKCFCGTSKCWGYIGGDISRADIIAQDDQEACFKKQDDEEAERFEPMAVDKDAEEVLGANGSCSHGANPDVEHEASIRREDSNDCPSATPELEPRQQTSGTLFDISEPENSLEALSPQDSEDAIRTPVHVSRTTESSLQQFPVYVSQSPDFLQKTPNTMDGSKASNVMNGFMSSSDLGSNLVPGFHSNKKNNLKHHRNVKPSSSHIDNEHILGVEGRLNNLLDGDGGISKRKDATNGYLKLLLVTAAEGDNVGGTSKSVRDLSLILDALLKTKSCTVLLDIIRKNGLQMLHNILKQNKSNFHRTPIIRKLLKVLEFLASKGILTSELINGGPRCAGMESFRDSMLSLTRHNDQQVHQIARNFRDTWIPRNIARSEPTEYPRASTSAQDIQGISAAGGSVSTSNCSTDWNFARRKRKSRWDYQPDDHYKMVGLKIQKVCSGHSELDLQTGLMRNKLQGNWGTSSYHNDVPVMGSSTEGADDEAPPGFESQQECQPAHASLDWGVAPGFCLERYQPNLSISYGIPVALVQHFGTPEVGGQCCQKWKVAPGVPFNPFPPLPPYPRGSPCPSTSSTQMSQHDGTLAMKHNSSGYCGRTADRGGRVHRNWQNGQRTRWPYNYQGRRFPSNHHRFERCRLPMSQEHGDSGFRGRE